MAESWRTRATRWGFNWFPAYRGTGAHIEYIASDWREVRIRLDLSWRTRNYVGTIFGGSMYASIDPVYMLMLIKLLGRDYIVWDKSATIRFLRPGRSTLFARFHLPSDIADSIRTDVIAHGKIDRQFQVELVDATGVVHASFTKTVHIRKKHRATAPASQSTS